MEHPYRHSEVVSPVINTLPGGVSVNAIFSEHWESYKERHWSELRMVEVVEVEKMLRCFEKKNGYAVYECPACEEQRIIHFNCHSRVCSRCGKLHADEWAKKLSKRLFHVNHRHVVMTIAEELRVFFEGDRQLLKVLMDCAIRCIEDVMGFWVTGRNYRKADISRRDPRRIGITPGIVVVLHTFGCALNHNPHVHVIMSEGGFNQRNEWVSIGYIPYRALRKTWQYQLLTSLKKHIPDTGENRVFMDRLFKKYKEGFYVRAKDTIKGVEVLRYIGRYVRHPVIANSRLEEYDGERVSFWYEREEGGVKKRFHETMPVDDFIRAILGHVPDKQFKMVRYYGAYARTKRRAFARVLGLVSIVQSKLTSFEEKLRRKRVECPNCGCFMNLVEVVKPPPVENWSPRVELARWC